MNQHIDISRTYVDISRYSKEVRTQYRIKMSDTTTVNLKTQKYMPFQELLLTTMPILILNVITLARICLFMNNQKLWVES